jgi:hypothetical protein
MSTSPNQCRKCGRLLPTAPYEYHYCTLDGLPGGAPLTKDKAHRKDGSDE